MCVFVCACVRVCVRGGGVFTEGVLITVCLLIGASVPETQGTRLLR